ncbi:MAG: DUF1353 domain-containing protein [Pseudomonadota bacterium]
MRTPYSLSAATAVVFLLLATSLANAGGRFEGELQLKLVLPGDGRDFVVLAEFSYVDSAGVRWVVPRGAKTNGASVPRVAWSIVPPLAGKHLWASVLHDHYCATRERPWEAVHRVFYDALLAVGVNDVLAKVMYAAVYRFGPKWLPNGAITRGRPISEKEAARKLNKIRNWIEVNNPDLKQIDKYIQGNS